MISQREDATKANATRGIETIIKKSQKPYNIAKAGDEIMMWDMWSTMLSSGVQILQTLTILRQTFPAYDRQIGIIHAGIKEGECLADAIDVIEKNDSYIQFHPNARTYLSVGEETGRLPEMCMKLSEFIAEQQDLNRKPYSKEEKGKIQFYTKLTNLVEARIPLLRCLGELRKTEEYPPENVIKEVYESIEAGSTFAEALAQHPKIFTKFEVNMVRGGEIGGVLNITLGKIGEYFKKAAESKYQNRSIFSFLSLKKYFNHINL